MRLTIRHVREAGLCGRGARLWVAREGLSWTEFLNEGFDLEFIREKNDPLANRAVAVADREKSEVTSEN